MSNKIKSLMMILILILSVVGNDFMMPMGVKASAGDDPGVTINTPDNISSKGLVDINVTLSSSAGKLEKDGTVAVTIPKSIVSDPSQLVSMLNINDPFYLDNPAYIDDGKGNYILNVKYDVTKIDPNEAVGNTFTIEFRAPYFTDHSEVDENLNFQVNLNVNNNSISKDNDNSKTVPSSNGKPAFTKYSNAPSINSNGVQQYVMSPTDPQSNQFVIIINYNKQSYDKLVVSDNLPKGLRLADSYSMWPKSKGDSSNIQHLKIYKVNFNDDGSLNNTEYVTSQFLNSIHSSKNSFNVNFGKVDQNDAYVITYGASVNDGYDVSNFGLQYNNASMSNNGEEVQNSKVPLIMHQSDSGSTSLRKKVDHASLSTNESTLIYTLELKNNSGTLKAGTIVTDPLPANTKFVETI